MGISVIWQWKNILSCNCLFKKFVFIQCEYNWRSWKFIWWGYWMKPTWPMCVFWLHLHGPSFSSVDFGINPMPHLALLGFPWLGWLGYLFLHFFNCFFFPLFDREGVRGITWKWQGWNHQTLNLNRSMCVMKAISMTKNINKWD